MIAEAEVEMVIGVRKMWVCGLEEGGGSEEEGEGERRKEGKRVGCLFSARVTANRRLHEQVKRERIRERD